MTRFSVLFCCAILSGCKTAPLGWTPSAPPPSHPPTISLFEKTAADRDAIKQTVLRHISPGTPMEQARAMLVDQGFTCHPYTQAKSLMASSGVHLPNEVEKRLSAERDRQPIYCLAMPHQLEEWHLKSFTVLVVLIPGDTQLLREVEIGLSSKQRRNMAFFQKRPDLHEPVGLPIETARDRMTAAGFRCSDVCPGKKGEDPRPYIHCEAFDESLVGGHIVRIRLYVDESGRICESKIVDKAELFDAERCMWLHGDESRAQTVGKAAAYPVRLSCRYALLTVAIATGLGLELTCLALIGLN
ncbi:MAG TPA: hypothetical protein VH592_11985 [Gemmataceae bacterium]